VPDQQSAALTPAAAEALLREILPGHPVAGIVPRTGGQLNSVYEVRLADAAPAVIVKVYAEAWRWKQAKEVHVYRLLHQHGVGPVRELLHADDASAHLHGPACTVMTLLAGQPLSAVSTRACSPPATGLRSAMTTSTKATSWSPATSSAAGGSPTSPSRTPWQTCSAGERTARFLLLSDAAPRSL
jgi:hypothetical protein